jgi:zinc transport system ATP-binding protein
MNAEDVLAAEGLSFGYGAGAGRAHVLQGVDLRVGPGEFVALVGPNGSGKTTLLRLLLGLAEPDAGSVRLLGTLLPAKLPEPWRLGYVPQRATIPEHLPATVAEVVTAGCLSRRGWRRGLTAGDRADVTHALESVALSDRAGDPVRHLSGGQQQRVLIAKALVSQPDLLVLDEPVAGVDTESQRLFRDALVHLQREHGAGVLLVSHELGAVAADLDRVVVLQRGTIAFDGAPAALEQRGVSLGLHPEDLPVWLED